jgi:hypothetical protein
MIRQPAVAGQFYPGTRIACLAEIEECLPAGPIGGDLPNPIVAGIVPHAGWTFSGDLAASVFAAIRQVNGPVDTFVLFGAAHRSYGGPAAVFDKGGWQTPLGLVSIDEDLAAQLAAFEGALADPSAHRAEHSIEVQLPFIQHLFPSAKIVPILVPPEDFNPDFGNAVGRLLAAQKVKKTVCIGSTDLTHYGPRYGFCPEGVGPDALNWAFQVNDMEFIRQALQMDCRQIVSVALEKQNACGPAAAAAAIAAARAMGASGGVLIGHTSSNDIMQKKFGQRSEESVGYAGIVF